MKLTLVSFQNIYALNGSAKFVKLFKDYEKQFLEKGVEINIFSNSKNFQDEEIYRDTRKHLRKTQMKKTLDKTFLGSIFLIYFSILKGAKEAVACLDKKEIMKKDHVVLLNDFFTLYYFNKRFPEKKETIFMMHNDGNVLKMLLERYPRIERRISQAWLKKIQNNALLKAGRIVFVSETARQVFNHNHPFFLDKTRYIPIGQEDKGGQVERKYDRLELITVGSICPRKNQFGILKVLSEMENKNIRFTMIGDGEQKKECEEYIRKKNMQGQVKILGSKKNVLDYLFTHNVFILFSLDEGLPISAQEALMCGLPLIITDVGGCRELVNGNGILIKNDPDDLKKAILYMDANRNTMKEMGEKSRSIFLEHYLISKMISSYIQLIKEF